MSHALDQALSRVLVEAARRPDEAFVARVSLALIAEERMRAQRRVLWRRLATEAAATAALAGSCVALARAAPGSAAFIPLSSPVWAGLLLLAVGMFALTATSPLKNADPR